MRVQIYFIGTGFGYLIGYIIKLILNMPRVEAFNNQPEKIEYFPGRLFRSITFAHLYWSYNLPI